MSVAVGIVGHEAAKFTPAGERAARALIRALLTAPGVTKVVSGGCHLGGIDIWAEEAGRELELEVAVYKPARRTWEGGYKQRNLQIAEASDVVHCLVVDRLPETYAGMRFAECYHCHRSDHVKSGGCWTMHRARRGMLHIIANATGGER